MSILGDQIRDWDEHVEGAGDMADSSKPFDGGVMLAVATLFDAWDELDARYVEHLDGRVVQAVKGLRETVEQVIE